MLYKHSIEIKYFQYNHLDELPLEWLPLLEKAKMAAVKAYAPYSNFQVGCAIQLETGDIITGNNQENAAYPSGLCAERTALFYYGAHYSDTIIKKIAIVAKHQYSNHWTGACPCGACRQVMLEYEHKQGKPCSILFQNSNNHFVIVDSTKDLLPFQFVGDILQKSNT